MTVEHETPRDQLAHTYDRAFYETLATSVRGSAEVIVSIVVDLVHPPRSSMSAVGGAGPMNEAWPSAWAGRAVRSRPHRAGADN